jgi:argininosuccinate synthase
MPHILQDLPVGKGSASLFRRLDTSAALHWMRAKGAIPTRTPRTSASPTRPTTTRSRAGAAVRRREARLVDCRRRSSPKDRRAAGGAFHISTAGVTYFNTTPLGRAVTGTMLVIGDARDDVHIWGDGSTYKGNDIERFYRYGFLPIPTAHLQAVARRAFIDELGGRKEMSSTSTRRASATR